MITLRNLENGEMMQVWQTGIDLDCFTWLSEHYPQDLQKIYAAFPMSERILWEENYKQDNKLNL